MNKIVEEVAALAEPVVRKHGCELWDVEYVKEGGRWVLRVYIDREGGVTLGHCEAISRELDPLLDERDPIPGSYTFEVSSAGAERTLKRASDFSRFAGHPVEVRLYRAHDGRKRYLGTLVGGDEESVEIEVDGDKRSFPRADVAKVRLRIVL